MSHTFYEPCCRCTECAPLTGTIPVASCGRRSAPEPQRPRAHPSIRCVTRRTASPVSTAASMNPPGRKEEGGRLDGSRRAGCAVRPQAPGRASQAQAVAAEAHARGLPEVRASAPTRHGGTPMRRGVLGRAAHRLRQRLEHDAACPAHFLAPVRPWKVHPWIARISTLPAVPSPFRKRIQGIRPHAPHRLSAQCLFTRSR